MLKFNPINHTYKFGEEEYISVTTLIKNFEEYKDWNEIADNYAKKHGNTGKYWRELWLNKGKVAANAGSLIHAIFEQESLLSGNSFQHETQDGLKIGIDLKNLPAGHYPELILYSNRYKVAGQADLIIINEDKTFELVDFKTDKEIKFESGWYYNRKRGMKTKEKYLFPLEHLDACSWNKYQIQLSIYAHILEGYGYKCNKLEIKHVISERDEDGVIVLEDNKPNILDVEIHECKFLKKEAKAILNTILAKNKLTKQLIKQ